MDGEFLRGYFDFIQLYLDVKKNTLKEFETEKDFVKYLKDYYEVKKADAKFLYYFITEEKNVEFFKTLEISENNEKIDFWSDDIEISFYEDTSYSNEGGSHDGGYEYVFKIDTEQKIFIGLEVINHN